MNHILEFFNKLLDNQVWLPRWHRSRWNESNGWLFIISDLLIWSAYFIIPLIIIKYLSKKQDIRFERLYFLFAAIILACGATHFLDVIVFWLPAYRLSNLMRLITGVFSWILAFYLVKFISIAVSLKSNKEFEAEIGQQEKEEQQDRESKLHMQTIFNSAPDTVLVIDEEGKIVNWNPRAEVLFGWPAEEVMNMPLAEVIIPNRYRDPNKKGLNYFSKIREASVLGNTTEILALNKQNDEVAVAMSISPTVVNGRQLFVSFVRDITEQKKTEEKIRQLNAGLEKRILERTEELFKNQEKYRLLFEDNPMPMWIIDLATYKFLGVNEAAIIHYGYNREEFLAMTALDITPWEEMELFKHADPYVNTNPVNYNRGSWKQLKKDGTIIHAEVVAHDIFFDGKEARFILSNDVTARIEAEDKLKESEDELNKLNQELEERINLRTIQLQTAINEMEAFTYSVSHDLRTPLRGIIGFATMLEEDHSSKLDNEAKRITSVIKSNTLKMARLIDDLLAFSRIGKQDIAKTGIDTQAMVKGVIVELSPENDIYGIEWDVQALPLINGDINAMRQVWINLISNAIKYSGKKGRPHIGIGSFIKEGQTAFFIKDNGVGFNNKYKEKLFKVFQRLHSSDQFEGSGVGLALVMKIVSKHGGKVWAEGEVDNGACFYFSLPAA